MTDICPECGELREEPVMINGKLDDPDCGCGFDWHEFIEKAKQHAKFSERVCPKCDLVRGTTFKFGITFYNRICNSCGYQFHDTIKFYGSKVYMGIIDHNGLESFVEVGTFCEKGQVKVTPESLYMRAELNEHRDAYAFMSEIPIKLAERVEKLFDSGKYKEAKKQLTLISLTKLDVDDDFKKGFNNSLGK